MRGALKRIGFALVVIAAFTAGQIARDAFAPPWAEASSVGGSAQPGTGSGALVGATSPTLTTPELGVATGTSLTLTQGVSAVTGVFTSTTDDAVTASCSSGACDAIQGTGINNGTSYGVHGVGAGGGFGVKGDGATTGGGVYGSCSGAGSGIIGENSSTGNGVRAIATAGGIAVKIETDATSPTVGAIRVTVQDTNPTSCTVGDLFVFTGGVLRICTATNTWTNVGAQ